MVVVVVGDGLVCRLAASGPDAASELSSDVCGEEPNVGRVAAGA